MKIATFINRPILSCVLSVFVVILGVIGLLRLPMEQFPEIAPADGYSSGQAIAAIKEVARQTLPAGYGYEFGAMTREEAETGNS